MAGFAARRLFKAVLAKPGIDESTKKLLLDSYSELNDDIKMQLLDVYRANSKDLAELLADAKANYSKKDNEILAKELAPLRDSRLLMEYSFGLRK